ncbi:MAG: DUF1049 domain-containing protein [Acidimicrobiales bacterium]|nr:DUF1049 domain-containing protein [Acidimicrobiales bacterium]
MAMEGRDPRLWKDAGGVGTPGGDAKRGPSVGLVVGGLVALALVLFIAQNTNEVEVNFLFLDFTASAWVVIVIGVVLGVLADRAFGFWWRRRRERRDHE